MINITLATHAVAFPSKLLASNGGEHIYNIQLTADMDNGTIAGKGAFIDVDLYAQAAAPNGFTAKIVKKATNGNWYVEVTANPNGAMLLYKEPVIAEDYSNKFKDYKNFYNANGSVVKGYVLHVGDVFELSAAGFDGTPAVNKTLSVNATAAKLGKLTVAA